MSRMEKDVRLYGSTRLPILIRSMKKHKSEQSKSTRCVGIITISIIIIMDYLLLLLLLVLCIYIVIIVIIIII